MKIDVARHMIRSGFRSGGELEGLLGVLKAECEPEVYRQHALVIAAAIDAIHQATVSKAIALFPALEAEVDVQIETYGRYL